MLLRATLQAIDALSSDFLGIVPLAIVAVLYLLAVARLAKRGVTWPRLRTASLLSGLALVVVAIAPPLARHDELFPVHVIQHLLLGLAAPLLLVLSAPVTLLLRALPTPRRRLIGRRLHRRWVRWLVNPLTGAVLAIGSMYALYLTPLYAATLRHPLLHDLTHLHFLAAGYLFCLAFVGLDPLPHRPSRRTRAALLVLALGLHGTLAKLLYVNGPAVAGLSTSTSDLDAWNLGAQIMWYGGDLADLALLVAFFAQWYRAAGRALASGRSVTAVTPSWTVKSSSEG